MLDTTILAYAVGSDHPLRSPCRAIVDAIGDGQIRATTTAEVIQDFLHVHARRGRRLDASTMARDYVQLLSPLQPVEVEDLEVASRLFQRHPSLGAFDATLAAVTMRLVGAVLLSADRGFGGIQGLRHVDPADAPAVARLIGLALPPA